MEPTDVVRQLFERMQARQWRSAEELLASDVDIRYTATGERFHGMAFLAMNEAYPSGWQLEVGDVLGNGDRVAAQVVVRQGAETFWCAGFYTVHNGRIVDGVEHWVTERSETPPAWRRPYATEI